jgi:hypothetical protein
MSAAHYKQEGEWNLHLARTCPDAERAAHLEAQARLFLKLAVRCAVQPKAMQKGLRETVPLGREARRT